MKRKIYLAFVCLISALFLNVGYVTADASKTVTVRIVSITDVNDPLRTIIPKRELQVENWRIPYADIAGGMIYQNDTIDVLDCLLDAVLSVYGSPQMYSEILVDATGNIVKCVDSGFVLCYKNGEDIFSLPQNVEVENGDDILICVYGIGYLPQVAKITASKTEDISLNEKITVNISEYYPDPTSNIPIDGLEICDENGEYILDENGDVLVTNGNGDVLVSFSSAGPHTIRFVPKINYVYFDDSIDETVNYTELMELPKMPAVLYSSSISSVPLNASVETVQTEVTISEGTVYNFSDYDFDSLPFSSMGLFEKGEDGKIYLNGESAESFVYFTW